MSASARQKKARRTQIRRDKRGQLAWLWVLLLLLLAVLTAILAASCGREGEALLAVAQSTRRRSPLEEGSLRETAFLTDRRGWLEENREPAEEGLEYFYEKTGVQPHIYLRESGGTGRDSSREAMDGYAAVLYGSLFSDEGHLLILVEEQEDSAPLLLGFAAGKQAATVMDAEALEILEAYWKTLLKDAPAMSGAQKSSAVGESLERTADNIMMVKKTGGWVWTLILLVLAILLLAGLAFRKNWMRLKEEEILSK